MEAKAERLSSPTRLDQLDNLVAGIRQILKGVSREQLMQELGQIIPPQLGEARCRERDEAIEALQHLAHRLLLDLNALALFLDERCSLAGFQEGRLVFKDVPTARGPIEYTTSMIVT